MRCQVLEKTDDSVDFFKKICGNKKERVILETQMSAISLVVAWYLHIETITKTLLILKFTDRYETD